MPDPARPSPAPDLWDPSPRLARVLLAILLVTSALYVFGDAARPFHQTDDFWYAEIVSRMIEDGDYLAPRFGPRADFNKPPLFYWLSVPAFVALDDPRVALRLLPGLAFLALCGLIYRMASRTHSRGAGLLAVAVFATTYDHLHNHGYKSGVPEGLLNLEIAGVLWLSVGLEKRPWRLPWIAALCGAAFMTKTAFAVVPVALAGTGLVPVWRQGRLSARLVAVSGAVFVATVAPWFIAVVAREGTAVLDQMFLDQVLGRMTNDAIASRTGRSFGRTETAYPIRHFLVWGAPWSLLLPVAGLGLARMRAGLDPGLRRLLGLCAVWLAVIFGAMLASRASWGWYISSAYVPASLAIGIFLREFLRGTGRVATAATLAVAAAAFVVLPTPLVYNPYPVSSGPIPLDGWSWVQVAVAAVLTGLLVWRLHAPRVDAPGSGLPLLLGAIALVLAALPVSVAWLAPAVIVTGGVSLAVGALAAGVQVAAAPALARGPGRPVVVCALFACALAYLAAPLVHLRADNRPTDVKWMEAQIAGSAFADGHELRVRTSLYSYIRLYQRFHDAYLIEYEPDKQLLHLRARPGSAS